jgi:hypothetical protein
VRVWSQAYRAARGLRVAPVSTYWTCALELGSDRSVADGSVRGLCDAIRRGADLRIYTEFRHNEHIDPASDNREVVREVSDFRVTYLVDNRWAAGIMTLRVPIIPPDGFGPRPSMSFFLYNQDGEQAIARRSLAGEPARDPCGRGPPDDRHDMPKYHQRDNWDAGSRAPCHNFVFDFDVYRFLVRDDWQEVLAHGADGGVVSGSQAALAEAFAAGAEVKVGIRGICGDLAGDGERDPGHELFVQAGPCYHNTGRAAFCAGTHPVVRVRAGIPMRYASQAWDFGWLMPRTDGIVAQWQCDPYTLKFRKTQGRHAVRWFVR